MLVPVTPASGGLKRPVSPGGPLHRISRCSGLELRLLIATLSTVSSAEVVPPCGARRGVAGQMDGYGWPQITVFSCAWWLALRCVYIT